MSILDRMGIERRQLPYRRPEDPHGPETVIESREIIGTNYYNGHTFEQGYNLRIVINTTWYANGAQLEGRERQARKELLYYIYGPVLSRFQELRSRVMDRDWRAAMTVLSEIEKELVE